MTTLLRTAAALVVIAAVGTAAYAFTHGANVSHEQSPSPSPVLSKILPGQPRPASRSRVTMVSSRLETFGKLAQFEFQATFPSGWTMQKRLPAEVQFQLQGPFVPYHFPYIGFFSVREVYKDPCHPEAGFAGALRAYQPNANDPEIYANNLETELKSMAGFDAGPSTSATIGGHQARHFTISNGIDTSTAGCTDGELLPLFATMDARDTQTELIWREHSPATNGGTTLEVWIVNGVERSHGLLIVGETGSHDPASGMRAIESILASITFSG